MVRGYPPRGVVLLYPPPHPSPCGYQVSVIERRKKAISERAYLAERNIEVLVQLKQVRGRVHVPIAS